MSWLFAVYMDDNVFWCYAAFFIDCVMPKNDLFLAPSFTCPSIPFFLLIYFSWTATSNGLTLFFLPFLSLVFAWVADVSPPAPEVGG